MCLLFVIQLIQEPHLKMSKVNGFQKYTTIARLFQLFLSPQKLIFEMRNTRKQLHLLRQEKHATKITYKFLFYYFNLILILNYYLILLL